MDNLNDYSCERPSKISEYLEILSMGGEVITIHLM